MQPIDAIQLQNKKVIMRADLDVAMVDGRVVEDYRLEAMVPTLQYLLGQKVSVVIIGHLGRPEGKVVPELSLRPVIARLQELVGEPIEFVEDWFQNPEQVEIATQARTITALENLRFDSREEDNDAEFAQYIAGFGDIFVNEAFSVSHREHASIVGIPNYLPSYAGLRLVQEIEELIQVRENPRRPLVIIMGGGKYETKVPIVKAMGTYADHILLGGKLMFAQELEGIKGVRFPVDAVRIDDIGPESVKLFKTYLDRANTIVWNGPVGKYEEEEYQGGTKALAEIVAQSGARKIIGGGDTIAALDLFGLLDRMDFVSTGGGAMLDFLADGNLAGLKALEG